MMRMELTSNKKRIRPVFVCDHCGQKITNARQAGAAYGEPGSTTIFHLHKSCDEMFCAERQERGEQRLAWTDLPIFLAQLGYSSGLRKAEADKLCEQELWSWRQGDGAQELRGNTTKYSAGDDKTSSAS